MKLARKMDMNLGVIMVKIFRVELFMVADNVNSYSYRCFLVIRKDSFRGQHFFFGAKICQQPPKICKKIKAENEKKSVMKIFFYKWWERWRGWNGRE